jgi:hypothetical protein
MVNVKGTSNSPASSRGSGGGIHGPGAKQNKRKRASKRIPTTVLEASCSDFRDMVQKLTGIMPSTVATANSVKNRSGIARPQPNRATITRKPTTSFEDLLLLQQQGDDDHSVTQIIQTPSDAHPAGMVHHPVATSGNLSNSEFFHRFLQSNLGTEGEKRSTTSNNNNQFERYVNALAHNARIQQQQQVRNSDPEVYDGGMSSSSSEMADRLIKVGQIQPASKNSFEKLALETSNTYSAALEMAQFSWREQVPFNHMDSWFQGDQVAAMRA